MEDAEIAEAVGADDELATEDRLRALNFLYSDEKSLEAALEILDHSKVEALHGLGLDLDVWRVQGSKSTYLCLWNFCSCRSYLELNRAFNVSASTTAASSATGEGSGPTAPFALCKHLLAVRAAKMMPNCEVTREVSNEEVVSLALAAAR